MSSTGLLWWAGATRMLRQGMAVLLTLVAVSAIAFFLLDGAAGDAATARVTQQGVPLTPASLGAARADLGLDRPLPERFLATIGDEMTGDLGISARSGLPVAGEIGQRLAPTLQLAGSGCLIALVVGLGIGLGEAITRRRLLPRLLRTGSLLLISIPGFALAFALVTVLSLQLGLLPTQGTGSLSTLVMPALVLGLPVGAAFGRVLSTRLGEVLDEAYLTTARASGFSRRACLVRFALPNVGVTSLVVGGDLLASVFSGTVVVEAVFGYPGLGTYLVSAIRFRDGPALQAGVLVLAAAVVAVRAVALAAAAALDPRARATL